VRFFLINRYDVAHAKIGVVYDACMICGDDGYIQVGNEIICIACNVRIFVPSIGKPGGCNPIPLDHTVEGGVITIAAADLDKGAKYFSEVVEIEVTDPVTGKRLINLKAPFQYEFKGRMFFFEGRESYDRFKKVPEDFAGNVEGRYFRVQGYRDS
jgi:YHS domain-containing protein/DNA-directed RNA polymerase subunit RPC12/RpoP